MRKLKQRHIGSVQRSHLAVTVKRRRKQRVLTAQGRLSMMPSPRAAMNARLRKAYLDQVELDKLRGLENGETCRAFYKEQRRKAREKEMRA